ncbi:MAG TPA: hypothetical protein VHS31_14585, partial [Tepidisphaeraceae bacterium]|nr:hypothetical protein [Tepidisphaeraceae bacterium]
WSSWRPAIAGLALCGAMLGAGGCSEAPPVSSGSGDQYSQYVMSLYNQPAVSRGPRTIEFPINVAAAEVGQTSAQADVLASLRNARGLFERVDSLPANVIDPSATGGRDPVQRLQSLARDQGADYLLIFGANVNTRTTLNGLSAIDLTIVGAFVPVTRTIDATAHASASLIDVRTGTVVLSTGADATETVGTSAVTESSDVARVSAVARKKSLDSLADQLIASAKRRSDEQAPFDDPKPTARAASARTTEK